MPYLVRDWWPTGNKYITWPVDNLNTAYQEYSGTAPATSADFLGSLTIVKQVATSNVGGSGESQFGMLESSIWSYDSQTQDLYLEYTIDGHTGCWALTLDTSQSAEHLGLADVGVLLQDGDDYFPEDLVSSNIGLLTNSAIETYPSTRNLPDPFWELSGDDLYLTGATA